jgi:hypothetical protein
MRAPGARRGVRRRDDAFIVLTFDREGVDRPEWVADALYRVFVQQSR